MTAEQEIIARLQECQSEMGLSHRKFAVKLGISPSMWVRLVKAHGDPGKTPLTVAIAKAAEARFPELKLRGYVGVFLLEEYPERIGRAA